jgi:predicted esterase
MSIDTLLVPATTHGRVLIQRPSATPAGVLVGFHGYAEDASVQLSRLTAIPGADAWLLVSVQALHRFYRGRSQDVVANWMTSQDRELAIADNVAYVDKAMEGATADSSLPIVYAGFSQGVAMAFRAALQGRRLAAGIIAVGGDVPPEIRENPGVRFPRTLLARGTGDDWYTTAKLEADVAAIERHGGHAEAFAFDGGHEWTVAVSTAAGRFLADLLAR